MGTMAMAVMDMVLDTTDMDSVTSARGLLMPNPRLMLMPLLMLTMDTTAVDTVTDMVSDTAVTTVDTTDILTTTDTVTSARGPLMPNPRLMPLLMLGTDITAMDTVMAVTMVDTTDIPMPVDTDMVVTDTTVRLSKSQLAIVKTPLDFFN